ncbi:MAG: hypothetical protein ACE3L7_00315 [Candidatus Pristimantibacillus sp.]
MKREVLILTVATTILFTGCSTQAIPTTTNQETALAQQDKAYYKEMNLIFDDIDKTLNIIAPSLAAYVNGFDKDPSKYKDIRKPAEEARVLSSSIIKRTEKVVPPRGLEDKHKKTMEKIRKLETGLTSIARFANGKDGESEFGLQYLRKAMEDLGVKALTDTRMEYKEHKE